MKKRDGRVSAMHIQFHGVYYLIELLIKNQNGSCLRGISTKHNAFNIRKHVKEELKKKGQIYRICMTMKAETQRRSKLSVHIIWTSG